MSFFILANDILFYLLNNKFRDNTSYKQMFNIRRLIKKKYQLLMKHSFSKIKVFID